MQSWSSNTLIRHRQASFFTQSKWLHFVFFYLNHLTASYLQMLLPCDQPYLRATATQRPTYPITQKEFLPFDVERALAKLIHKELKLAHKQEQVK